MYRGSGQFSKLVSSKVDVIKNRKRAYIDRATPMFTEVGMQNCDSPIECNHATWNYFKSMVEAHTAKDLTPTPKTKVSGSLVDCWSNGADAASCNGVVAKASVIVAARVAAKAATGMLEGFVVNIYTDGELVGSATTDTNGSFSIDMEFDSKRTYVTEVFPPASMDAATAPRADVATITGAELEKANFTLPNIMLVSKTFQQGILNVQLKDGSTGAALWGYSLSMENGTRNKLLDNKLVNTADDASLTLPMASYKVNVSKSGYVAAGTKCWVKANSTNTCVATMLPEGYTTPTPSLSVAFTQPALDDLGATGSGYELITGNNGRPAAKFNGGSIIIPNRPEIQFTDGATFDVWARLDSNVGMNGWGSMVADTGWAMALMAKSHDRSGFVWLLQGYEPAASGTGFGLSTFATFDPSWSTGGDTCQTLIRNPGVPVGQWFRVTGVASATTGLQMYVNKQLAVTCPDIHPSFAAGNTQDMYLGKYSDYWYPFNGAMQDLNIYQKALTDAEVQALP